MKYKHEKHIPNELLCWHDIEGDLSSGYQLIDHKKPGRNDELVRIGQALLQGILFYLLSYIPTREHNIQ